MHQQINYVIANWKMNGNWEQNAQLLNQLKLANITNNTNTRIVICPAFPYLIQCKGLLNSSKIEYGAQDIAAFTNGAYTGDVSISMLVDLGCKYTIIGHSERRIYHNESDNLIAQKTNLAINNNITPILCVGETLEQREAGQTKHIVCTQLENVISTLKPYQLTNLILAYEPVWAIGTGKTASAEQAEEVHTYLRSICYKYMDITPSILYGGSVKPTNAKEIFSMPNINGGLIGGSSLIVADFISIINSIKI